MSICEIGFGKCCGVQCFTKRSVPIVTSHVTSEPVLRLDVPNRCFWRISQLPRSFVCPCPSSFKNASLESNSKQAVFFFFFFFNRGCISVRWWLTDLLYNPHTQNVFFFNNHNQTAGVCFAHSGHKARILCTLIMCDFWFVKRHIPENRSPDIRNSHFPPSLCSSLFLFLLVGPPLAL